MPQGDFCHRHELSKVRLSLFLGLKWVRLVFNTPWIWRMKTLSIRCQWICDSLKTDLDELKKEHIIILCYEQQSLKEMFWSERWVYSCFSLGSHLKPITLTPSWTYLVFNTIWTYANFHHEKKVTVNFYLSIEKRKI